MSALLFATSNGHKVEEANAIFGSIGFEIQHFPFSHVEIRSDSVEEIAVEAVNAAFNQCKKPVFVDDTGLFIDSLNGFPGTYSAWAAKKIGNDGILRLLSGSNDRNAIFRTCIAYHSGKSVHTFIGECRGKIALSPKGKTGFGYDPIFIPAGHEETFSERIDLKNKLSHRYISLLLFSRFLKDNRV